MTASHSSSVMFTSMRSRRIPALFTSTCRSPNVSTAFCTSRRAPSKSATFSPFAIASPPIARISSTTSPAGPVLDPLPSTSAPRSLTTTFAPWCANSSAWPRPMPRPAPVTMTTRPSQIPIRCLLCRLVASPAVCDAVLVAQATLVDLPIVVARQACDEVDGARALVVRELLTRELDELGRELRRAGDAPGASSTTAFTTSPHSASGTPMVATSSTAGCSSSTLSTSAG